jgi:hypothetical protein
LRRTVRPRDPKKRQSHLRDAPNSFWLTDPSLSELSRPICQAASLGSDPTFLAESYHMQPGNLLVIGRRRQFTVLEAPRVLELGTLPFAPTAVVEGVPRQKPARRRRTIGSGACSRAALQLRCWFHAEATAGARLLALCSCHWQARHSRLRPNAEAGAPASLVVGLHGCGGLWRTLHRCRAACENGRVPPASAGSLGGSRRSGRSRARTDNRERKRSEPPGPTQQPLALGSGIDERENDAEN